MLLFREKLVVSGQTILLRLRLDLCSLLPNEHFMCITSNEGKHTTVSDGIKSCFIS